MRTFLLMILGLVLTCPAYAEKPKEVKVVNQPTVKAEIINPDAITIGADVDATITNTPDVNIANIPSFSEEVSPYLARGDVFYGATAFTCYFDVPVGKLLHIEQVSGATTYGVVEYLALVTSITGDIVETYVVPTTTTSSSIHLFQVQAQSYARDTDLFSDGLGEARDVKMDVITDASGNSLFTSCTIVGRLYADE